MTLKMSYPMWETTVAYIYIYFFFYFLNVFSSDFDDLTFA